jgi:hypothetical protein
MSSGGEHVHGGKRRSIRYSNKHHSRGKRRFHTMHKRKTGRKTAKKSRKPRTLFERLFGF